MQDDERLDVLVLLTLVSAGESPTCIIHEGIHTPKQARLKYQTQLAKMSFDAISISADS